MVANQSRAAAFCAHGSMVDRARFGLAHALGRQYGTGQFHAGAMAAGWIDCRRDATFDRIEGCAAGLHHQRHAFIVAQALGQHDQSAPCPACCQGPLALSHLKN